MREFYRGWKRKVGVVTLLVACVLTSAWIRSLSKEDEFRIPAGKRTEIKLVAENGYLMWLSLEFDSDNWVAKSREWNTFPLQGNYLVGSDDFGWTLKYHDLGYGFHPRGNDVAEATLWYLSYRSVVFPLTLLSAWLFLSKQPPAKAKVHP